MYILMWSLMQNLVICKLSIQPGSQPNLIRLGESTNVLVLKSALSTFFAVLEGTLEYLSGKVFVLLLMLEFFFIKSAC